MWEKPQAHQEKTLTDTSGKESKIDFKKYLIKEIEQIFIKYTPEDIYYKILFELFGSIEHLPGKTGQNGLVVLFFIF